MNTGLILAADEEAELAGVLAHETAHVAARHGAETASKQAAVNLASIPLMFVGGVAGLGVRETAGLAIPIGFLKFTRSQEAEADYLGSQYMHKAGYDPSALLGFFEKLEAKERSKPGGMSKLFIGHLRRETASPPSSTKSRRFCRDVNSTSSQLRNSMP